MQSVQDMNIQKQIDEEASQIREYYRSRKLVDRLTEHEVRTTEPDSIFCG
jgi:hypothetical protein